jgi:hypothetical protein
VTDLRPLLWILALVAGSAAGIELGLALVNMLRG